MDNSLPRPCQTEQITPRHPPLIGCYGSDIEVLFHLPVPHPGRYAVVVEYANEEDLQTTHVAVSSPKTPPQQGTLTFYPCKFSFLCRGVALDAQQKVAFFDLTTEVTIRFSADRTQLHLGKIFLVPADQYTMEYVEPRVHCIAVHGSFNPSSGSCTPSRFHKPSQSVVLTEGTSRTDANNGQKVPPLPPTAVDATKLIRLQTPETEVTYNGHIQTPGRYAFIIHYYQPSQPSFTIEVQVHGGRVWRGSANATFCPHGFGCRSLVLSEDQAILDVTDNDLSVTVRVPDGKIIWLEYILVIPEDSYSSSYLVEEPLDKSYYFISQCGANSFQSNPANSKFCRDAAISLSLFYNNGAQSCNCHEAGSLSTTCEPQGGQCSCKPNVIGRDCSRCATGFWGFPDCRPCDCGSRLCDEVTGQCICPPHTVKPECTVCQPQTFGCHPLVGCEECDCSETGLQNITQPGCDIQTGQCTCKPNIMGRRCEKCAPGYYGYPNCRPCECNRAGTEQTICDPVTGQCLCKENVEGRNCDQCRLGTFFLDANNPKGCTRCFCFGATDRCHTGSKYRTQFNDMRGWVLVGGDRQEVEITHLAEGLIEADLRDVPDVYQEFYWHAPRSYLGDRVSSYGGYLTYELNSEAIRGDQIYIPVERRPDIILKGNQMSIAFLEPRYPLPGDIHRGRVQLIESNFIHIGTNYPVSREDIMMVLANLEALQIRALNSQSSSMVSLRQVILEIGQGTGVGVRASNVELCICAPGYYGNPMVIGSSCLPCNCNGNTDSNMLFSECHPLFGTCSGCMFNTAGPHCEVCAPGFYGDAIMAKNCTSCNCSPCGTDTCEPRTGRCQCKAGVTGPTCNRCEEGYFGFDGCSGCQRCSCGGGSTSSTCDPQTGQCHCLPGVTGSRCQQCAPGYWSFGSNGCTKCHCKGGSCDPRTGECKCSDGLTGKQCDTCSRPYEVPVSHGQEVMKCEPCDSCVVTLLEDLQRMADFIPSIRDQLTNLSISSIAWTRLGGLNASIANLTDLWLQYQSLINAIKDKADDLEDDSFSLAQDFDALQEKVNSTNRMAVNAQKATRETSQNAADLLNQVQSLYNVSLGLIQQLSKIGSSNTSNVTSTEEFRQIMTDVEKTLREMRDRDFGYAKDLAGKEHEEGKKLLDRVKAELLSSLTTNQGLLHEVKKRLENYSSNVMDLRDAMNEALSKTRETEELNNQNYNNLEENKLKINDLNAQHKELVDALTMGEDAIAQVSNISQMLDEMKEDYERMAAQLDGSKASIMDKVQKFSPASNKLSIVEQAEEHARLLTQVTKNLVIAIGDSNQDEFIQKAINASNAYSSIIDAIRQADKAAKDASRAAGETHKNILSEELGKKGRELHNNSTKLEGAAKTAQNDLNGDVLKKLQEAKKKLQDGKTKKESLQSELSSVIDQISTTQDNVTNQIAEAKVKATKANNTASMVQTALNGIKKNLDEWKDKYGTMKNEDVNKAVEEANTTVSNLENTIPLLLDKLNKLDQQGQNNNISDSIKRIRQLISQARDAASKVRVPVKFNGSSGVQLRTPNNLPDLAAHTYLKLHIQNPNPQNKKKRQAETEPTRFVMFLGHKDGQGDYLGAVLRSNRLQCIYRLGDQEPTYLSANEDIKEQFVTVVIERILQYAQMSIFVTKDNLHEFKGDSTAGGEQGLLNLDPQRVVFYVGGYPADFKPPSALNHPNYKGCIELDTLNEKPISLYDFERTFQLDTTKDKPCPRYPDHFMCLAAQEGQLSLYYNIGSGTEKAKPIESLPLFISTSTSKAIQVIVAVIAGKKRIFVRFERLNVFSVEYDGGSLESSRYFYLGGLPLENLPEGLKEIFPSGGSIRGCMKGLKALGKYVDLKRMNSTGVSYGCTSDLLIARSVHLNGHGYLNMNLRNVPNFQDDFYTGFGFQTNQRNGLMYHHTNDMVLDLQQNIRSVNVTMKCEDVPEERPQEIRALVWKDKLKMKARQRKLALMEQRHLQNSSCHVPKPLKGALRFSGSSSSHLEFTNIPGSLQERFHFSMDVRLNSSSGLVFYVADEQGTSSLSLSVSNSRFVLMMIINGKTHRLRSKEKYTNGQWHTIFFGKEKNKLRLVIDGLKAQSVPLPPGSVLALTSPIYIGGAPALRNRPDNMGATRTGFHGCLRNLKMDGKPLDNPAKAAGVTPCFEGFTEQGIFFSDGGFMTFGSSIDVGQDLELKVEVRPMHPSGLIFHLHTEEGYTITLSAADRKVTLVVTDRKGKHSTAVHLQQPLCDGQWHTITVTKGSHVIQLDVDDEGNHLVGASPSSHMSKWGTLYVGGVPVNALTAEQPLSPYQGCMKNLIINRKLIDVSKSGIFTGAAGVNVCPAL
ncbi:hypothetical protein GDO78_004706 [Eleutherodactylus coqui]|nr:hypothetical protein GDO78_004706 [Eleutherodactylus coqui]